MYFIYIYLSRLDCHIEVSIKSITPAGLWLYLSLFEPRLVISRGPGPGGTHPHIAARYNHHKVKVFLTSLFEHNHQQVSDLERSRSRVSSEPFVFPSHLRCSVTSSIPHLLQLGRRSCDRSIQFAQFLTTLVSADSAIVKQMISPLCQNNPNLVERKERIKMTKGGGHFHLVINVQMSTKAESDTTF